MLFTYDTQSEMAKSHGNNDGETMRTSGFANGFIWEITKWVKFKTTIKFQH